MTNKFRRSMTLEIAPILEDKVICQLSKAKMNHIHLNS